jgi:hypothetical protein
LNEAETRAEHIDPALAAAGWGVVEESRIRREYPITLGRIEGQGRRGKALTADYVLVYRNTKLAVVEAKGWQEVLTEGLAADHFAEAIHGRGRALHPQHRADAADQIDDGQCLDRRRDSQEKIATEVAAWKSKRNAPEVRIHWTFTLAVARRKLRNLYPSNED